MGKYNISGRLQNINIYREHKVSIYDVVNDKIVSKVHIAIFPKFGNSFPYDLHLIISNKILGGINKT